MAIEVASGNATSSIMLDPPEVGPWETQGLAFEAARSYHDQVLTDNGFELDPDYADVTPEHIGYGETGSYRILYRKQGKRGYIYRCLHITIYRYDHSGRYELTAYAG